MGDAASPGPTTVLSSVDGSLDAPNKGAPAPGSRRTSRNSVDYAASRRASYGMLAPPGDSSQGTCLSSCCIFIIHNARCSSGHCSLCCS
ncbi:hypothetical protein HPB48_023878 [Haemaphysalis longicornis]|uniref:Uncharacterized protein n=1 Tax=Haemaphysalis longicornis TaxID=44386 RepID=A0A9J6GXC4_HAELO|nr:hypothetical protein HPB48_023878 [Haemaphysalis longicornis]